MFFLTKLPDGSHVPNKNYYRLFGKIRQHGFKNVPNFSTDAHRTRIGGKSDLTRT